MSGIWMKKSFMIAGRLKVMILYKHSKRIISYIRHLEYDKLFKKWTTTCPEWMWSDNMETTYIMWFEIIQSYLCTPNFNIIHKITIYKIAVKCNICVLFDHFSGPTNDPKAAGYCGLHIVIMVGPHKMALHCKSYEIKRGLCSQYFEQQFKAKQRRWDFSYMSEIQYRRIF